MSEREWRFYLDDMLRFAEKVRTYSAGLDQAAFEQDELKYDAILRNLELIGEAATHGAGRGAGGAHGHSLAADRRHPQSPDTRLPRHR